MRINNPSQPSLSYKGRSLKERNQAFTLVELIVVITILAILGTIAFMSFQGYSRDSRDSVRISDLKNIEVGLELYKTKVGKYPTADNAVEITASGTVFSYQGVAGDSLLSKLRISNGGKDPVDQTYYTYMTTSNLYNYELMGFLENGNKVAQVPSSGRGGVGRDFLPQANAASYINRFPKVMGDELGILLDSTTNEPIQSTGTGVDILNTTTNYKAYFNTTKSVTGTGGKLFSEYYNRTRSLLANKALAKQDPSLVLYMDMETTTTSGALTVLKDLSQYGNNGSCYNSGTIVDCGGALGPQFLQTFMNFRQNISQNKDKIQINDSSSLNILTNEFTITGWYKLDKPLSDMNSLYPIFLIKRPRRVGGYAVHFSKINPSINTQYCYISWCSNSSFNELKSLLKSNKWYFFTGIKTKTGLYSYNDGVLISSNENLTNDMGNSLGEPLEIGIGFEGKIDEVRIYDRVLSNTEIKALYDSSK